jgi:hypothetical protein
MIRFGLLLIHVTEEWERMKKLKFPFFPALVYGPLLFFSEIEAKTYVTLSYLFVTNK